MKQIVGCVLGLLLLACAQTVDARQSVPVRGTWDPAGQKISVAIGRDADRALHLKAEKVSETGYDFSLTAVDWNIQAVSLSTVVKGALTRIPGAGEETDSFEVKLVSKYTLLNQRPAADECEAVLSLRDGTVTVKSFRFGDIFASGTIGLGTGRSTDLVIRFDNAALRDLVQLAHEDARLEAGGNVSGEVRIQGTGGKMQVRGNISSYNGFIGGHAYNSAQINFAGIYPLLYIDQSHIAQVDGLSFEVQGTLDLADLKNLKRQLDAFVGSPLVAQRGKTLEWTFKRLKSHEKSGTTELKYMIKKDETSGQDVNILGVQRRMEF